MSTFNDLGGIQYQGAVGAGGGGGSALINITNDNTTATAVYPVFARAADVNQTLYIDTTAGAFSFVPSTKTLTLPNLTGNAATASAVAVANPPDGNVEIPLALLSPTTTNGTKLVWWAANISYNQDDPTIGGQTLLVPNILVAEILNATQVESEGFIGPLYGAATGIPAIDGQVGNIVSSSVAPASGVALTSNAISNVTSIDLDSGNWTIFGYVGISFDTLTAATTASMIGGTSAVNNALDYTLGFSSDNIYNATIASPLEIHAFPPVTVNVTDSSQTFYLNALANFTGVGAKAFGVINAILTS